MRVLLCTLNSKYIHTNLAIRLLYQLNKHQKGLEWKEFTIKEDRNDVAEHCAAFDVVAFSCYIWNITPTLEVCRLIRKLNPQVKILLGGPEVSYENENLISLPEVDFIIEGEGENAFSEFLKHPDDPAFVPNLCWKDEKTINRNKHAPVFDLQKLQEIQPYGDDNKAELRNKVLYMETSRGCPYKCGFCLASLDNAVRYLPNATIKSTLKFLMDHGRVIKFLDRTFNIKKNFTLDIFEYILEHHRPGNIFQFEITADILHADIIRFINERVPKGLFRFEIGIQTVNQQANLAVSRKQNFDKTRGIITQLQHKVEMHLDLIVGLPLDRMTEIRNSFEEVFALHPPELQLGFLKFLKGTPVRDQYAEHGFVFDPEPPYQIIRSNYLSENELKEITQLENALEIYWNSGKARNTLKYAASLTSIFDFLKEVGVFFGTRHAYHKYSLNDAFDVLYDYAEMAYPQDQNLKEIIAIDYYLHFKIRPPQRYQFETDKKIKNNFIQNSGLDHRNYKYIVLPVSFQPHTFFQSGEIVLQNCSLVIQYSGTKKAIPVFPELLKAVPA